MAIFHLSTKPIKRSDGRSSTAAAAYRAGCEINDRRTGKTHDYSKKSGVLMTDCFMFEDGEKVRIDRSELWNLAERTERRKDSRTAREILVNLPHELSLYQHLELVDDFTKSVAERYGVAIDYALHAPDKEGDQRNHHCHIMMTTRAATLVDKRLTLGDKTALELSNAKLLKMDMPKTQDQIKTLRKEWAEFANSHLDAANVKARIDHRSFEEQGSVFQPTIKLGTKASEFERLGYNTEKGDINRQIRNNNLALAINIGQLNGLENELNALSSAPKPAPKSSKKIDAPDLELRGFTKVLFEGVHKERNAMVMLDGEQFEDTHENWLQNVSEFAKSLSRDLKSAEPSNREYEDSLKAIELIAQLVDDVDKRAGDTNSDTQKIRDESVNSVLVAAQILDDYRADFPAQPDEPAAAAASRRPN